jgi:hypothetical protein
MSKIYFMLEKNPINTTWLLLKLTLKYKKVLKIYILGFWKALGTSHNNVRFAKE